MAKNSKFGTMEQFLVHFGPFWRGQILVDLAGLQTPHLMWGIRPPSDAGHHTPHLMRGINLPPDAAHQTPPPSDAPHQTPPPEGHKFSQKSQRLSGHIGY